MAKKHHEWLACVVDQQMNEAVARFVQNGDNRFEEDALEGVICADGKRRNFWRCTHAQALFLKRSYGNKIAIFNRIGAARPRNVSFLFKEKRRLPKNPKGKI